MNIKDFKWTEKRFGTRFAKILKGLGFSDENTEDIKVTDANGKVNTLVTDSNFKSILAKNGTLTEVTWQELKDKRDAGKLTPGALYRITDYQCTTTQENTRSAGHQFDIVLLALSKKKLAEEGWAMMHDNIYDVTFSDGVTKKCYIYPFLSDGYPAYNIVDVETLLAYSEATENDIQINENNKTASSNTIDSTQLEEENISYNYFQNSNLSAWKVWYCLDNDKSRFAWADDSVDGGSPAKINNNLVRSVENDVDGKYAWYNTVDNLHRKLYTDKEIPEVGDTIYYQTRDSFGEYGTVSSYTPAQEGTGPNGRGVIYRLIDEWNNDVPYDFKNIQFKRKITDGTINPSTGTDTYVYTFSVCNDDTKELSDYSVTCKTFLDDEGGYALCYENKIKKVIDIVGELHILNNVIFYAINIPDDTTIPIHHNICVHTLNLTIGYGHQAIENNIFIAANAIDYHNDLGNSIIVRDMRATFENIT